MTARDRLSEVVVGIEAELSACTADTPVNHKASLYGQLTNAVSKLAALDGEGVLTVSAILRSRAWGEIEAVLLSVLRKHPGAADDLAERLDALRGGAK
jgi:hypothetical protein